MPKRLADATLVINNVAIPIVPNSLKYKEGKGEQTITAQAAGPTVQTVFANNLETSMSSVGFSITNTAENIELARGWKSLENANAITITGTGFARAFNNMALTNDYEVNLGADTTIDLEFTGDPSV